MKRRDDVQYKIQLSENLKSADKVSTIYLALWHTNIATVTI